MSNEPIKAKPPTCRELQTRIDELRTELNTTHTNISELREEIEIAATYANSLSNQIGILNRDKLDAEASRMITADVKSALSTATKYYEQAHAIFNDTLSASKQVAKSALELREYANKINYYLSKPWYWRIFHSRITLTPGKEKS